jgi:hypothetical protein
MVIKKICVEIMLLKNSSFPLKSPNFVFRYESHHVAKLADRYGNSVTPQMQKIGPRELAKDQNRLPPTINLLNLQTIFIPKKYRIMLNFLGGKTDCRKNHAKIMPTYLVHRERDVCLKHKSA